MNIFDYNMFLIPLAVIVSAQSVKFLIFTAKHGLNWNYLLSPGHMPSAHSAFVASLVTTVGYYDGTKSPAFAVAVAFATIVIYDAMRIRMHIGDQGKFLNQLVRELPDIDKSKFPRLKERVGHYSREVIAGVIFGIASSALLIALTN
ncbi:MAG TPA: divergent PAP2 family protein [Candidatus Moranbacteria bacterium]|nr:divergent PAP2 family protein [Candidatus Moranbacteria bacterium]